MTDKAQKSDKDLVFAVCAFIVCKTRFSFEPGLSPDDFLLTKQLLLMVPSDNILIAVRVFVCGEPGDIQQDAAAVFRLPASLYRRTPVSRQGRRPEAKGVLPPRKTDITAIFPDHHGKKVANSLFFKKKR